jgi:uncharacterized protein
MQKGIVSFDDLREGMTISGKIKNVVDFGAFVDLGIKETALIHISELSDHYVKDPMDLLKVGDVLEFRIIGLDRDRRRISLSRKSERSERVKSGGVGSGVSEGQTKVPSGGEREAGGSGGRHAGKKVVAVRKAGSGAPPALPQRPAAPSRPFGSSRPDDDGTMYNPFAEAFRKMKEKK